MILAISKIILQRIRQSIRLFARSAYWYYRLSRAEIGSSVILRFPLRIEGSGKLILADFSNLNSGSEIGIGSGASVYLGVRSVLEGGVTVRVRQETRLKIGNESRIETGTRLFVNGDWKIGDQCKISTNCAIFAREPDQSAQFVLGDGSAIGDYTIIDLCDDVIIGTEVALGPHCILYTHDHEYASEHRAAWKGGLLRGKIVIEHGAWIGARVLILPGITIGQRAVVAAGSVVTKDVLAGSVVAGIPAREIRMLQ